MVKLPFTCSRNERRARWSNSLPTLSLELIEQEVED